MAGTYLTHTTPPDWVVNPLVNSFNLTGETSGVWGNAANCKGVATGKTGNLSLISGDISNLKGAIPPAVRGEVSNLIGTIPALLTGDVSKIIGQIASGVNGDSSLFVGKMAPGITGNISNVKYTSDMLVFGDVSGVSTGGINCRGNVSNISQFIEGLTGDVSNLTGVAYGAYGDATYYSGNLADAYTAMYAYFNFYGKQPVWPNLPYLAPLYWLDGSNLPQFDIVP